MINDWLRVGRARVLARLLTIMYKGVPMSDSSAQDEFMNSPLWDEGMFLVQCPDHFGRIESYEVQVFVGKTVVTVG